MLNVRVMKLFVPNKSFTTVNIAYFILGDLKPAIYYFKFI